MMKKTLVNSAEVAIMTAVISVCAWVTLPMQVPFTLQTFGVFLALQLLGGAKGTLSVIIYLLLGMVGAPVFSGFRGGLSVVLGPTGGYMVGFIVCCLLYWATEKLHKNKIIEIAVLIGGIISYFAFGTVWFSHVYSAQGNSMTVKAILGFCVFPFIIPDLAKLALSAIISKKVKKVLPKFV